MDRQHGKQNGIATPRGCFDYTVGSPKCTPEDPIGIHKVCGTIENASPLLSLALCSGLDRVYQAAIDNSSVLQSRLGTPEDPGGLHWVTWDGIESESVGHSSPDLTKEFV
jgi:hypothetical protein